jgi:hypothetical protein
MGCLFRVRFAVFTQAPGFYDYDQFYAYAYAW